LSFFSFLFLHFILLFCPAFMIIYNSCKLTHTLQLIWLDFFLSLSRCQFVSFVVSLILGLILQNCRQYMKLTRPVLKWFQDSYSDEANLIKEHTHGFTSTVLSL
jgi:hypothetical protein